MVRGTRALLLEVLPGSFLWRLETSQVPQDPPSQQVKVAETDRIMIRVKMDASRYPLRFWCFRSGDAFLRHSRPFIWSDALITCLKTSTQNHSPRWSWPFLKLKLSISNMPALRTGGSSRSVYSSGDGIGRP